MFLKTHQPFRTAGLLTQLHQWVTRRQRRFCYVPQCRRAGDGGRLLWARYVWVPSSRSVLGGYGDHAGHHLWFSRPRPRPCPAKWDTVATAPEDRCGSITREWQRAPSKTLCMDSQRRFNPENAWINDQKRNKLFILWILIQQVFTEHLCQALCGPWR